MPHKDLISKCIKGERKAQAELYKALYPELMSICRRYLRNEIDSRSLVNQSYFKILKNLDKKKENVPFQAWYRRITINTVISDHRKRRKTRDHETLQGELTEEIMISHNSIDHQIEAEALQHMLDTLPDRTRSVFNLFSIDGFAHKEIAEMLGISENTSKWHVNLARKKLSTLLVAAGVIKEAIVS